jgi:asparagine synthase (glutamine-hydrolysing)
MLRYLALVWDETNPQQQDTVRVITRRLPQLSSTWLQEFSAPGMQVFCAGARSDTPRIHRIGDDGGIVIGTLFKRSRDPSSPQADPPLQFGPDETHAYVQSHGRWLIDHGWGDYVAFGRSADYKWVLKDPTGSLPCLRSEFRGVSLFFSRLGDCIDLQLRRFTINDEFLRAHLMIGTTMRDLPALNEVSPVRRGECVEFRRSGTEWSCLTHLYWNPLTFTGAGDLIEDPDIAAEAMRNVIKATTHSLASQHSSLLLRLSGGLDSSIVAGCLKDAPTSHFSAYTYFNPHGRSDERPWARMAAQHAGCEHIEYPLSPFDMDLRLGLQMPPSPEPSPLLGFIQRSTVEQELTARTQATGIFGGDGGDSGFCADSLVYAVPEFLRNHGLAPGIFRLAARVALITQRSTWSVLSNAIRRRLTGDVGTPREILLAASQLVNEELKHDAKLTETISHPWFRGLRHVPWGKLQRLGTLIALPDYYTVAASPDAPVPEIVMPLYSQPVLELLLRIPIYVHFHEGRDRGLARKAFRADVPEPILRRLWKDRAPGFHDPMFERQRGFLQETLLEGTLVRQGLLNRALLEEVLSPAPSKNTVYPGEVFRHLDTELWSRHWLHSTQQQAAA